jgi:glycosyltransferase involved in cell wall biosynthesis
VLSVGTIERRKNLLTLVQAVESLEGVPLVAIGRQTAYAAEVLGYVRSRGLEGRVRLLSGVATDELAAVYRLATVFSYPSQYEGFGIPILEALFSGTPVVTSRGGCFEEAGGGGSVYVESGSVEALREALRSLLGDPARREAMRAAGLAHARRFRPEALVAGLGDAYRDALGSLPAAKVAV